MKTWFGIETSLIDRDDLTAYEKLCCVVIARYAGREEFNHLINVDTLAKKMAVSSHDVKVALEGLFKKGLITEETSATVSFDFDDEEANDSSSLIKLEEQQKIKSQNKLEIKPMEMPIWDDAYSEQLVSDSLYMPEASFRKDEQELSQKRELDEATRKLAKSIKKDARALDKVMELIEEPINARQGRIILELANRDIDKIRVCYRKVQMLSGDQRIDGLIECLQSGDYEMENPSEQFAASNREHDKDSSDIRNRIGGQVNKYRLEQMKKYSNFKKKNNR